MRAPANFLPTLLLALLAACGPRLAFARDASGGAAPGAPQFKPASPEDLKDPAITQPKEPGVDCVLRLTQAETANVRDNAKIAELRKKCLPQADAFKTAAEAASYLAFYQQTFSDYGVKMQNPEAKGEIQEAVKACLNGDPRCSDSTEEGNQMRNKLFQALVQYNYGKEVRAQMLENQTRARNMATLDLSAKDLKELGWQGKRVLDAKGVLPVNRAKDTTFRLDPKDVHVFDPDRLTAEERVRLGTEFNQVFGQFVNEYTSSTGQRGPKSRWAYVAVKSAAVGGNGFVYVTRPDARNQDTREGKSAIDRGRLAWDVKTQESKVVDEIVAGYRESYKDVNATPTKEVTTIDRSNPNKQEQVTKETIDSMKRAYDLAGFGLPKSELKNIGTSANAPKNADEVAAAVVVTMNKAIVDTEREKQKEAAKNAQNERVPSSAGPGAKPVPIAPSVTWDVATFDRFLDDIWPPGAKREEGTF